jgi:signal transduction histidine kinase
VPDERLGLRVSIEERMANAGGSADIASAAHQGTTVTIAWPAGAAGGDA